MLGRVLVGSGVPVGMPVGAGVDLVQQAGRGDEAVFVSLTLFHSLSLSFSFSFLLGQQREPNEVRCELSRHSCGMEA